MKNILFLFILMLGINSISCKNKSLQPKEESDIAFKILNEDINPEDQGKIVLMVHGGASYPTIVRNNPARDSIIKSVMSEALRVGRDTIVKGGSSTDAVQLVIQILENSPFFNAGKGSVFSSKGINELDASIMDGSNLKAGAVAGVTTLKNPIAAARIVMDSSDNVLLAGKGAEHFTSLKGAELADASYFFSIDSWNELIRAKTELGETIPKTPMENNTKFGTVGAVALDINMNISAGTSTGGRNNKRFGRIGDSPIIGASTYADNRYCGVSSTGWGELFIRNCTAHSVVSYYEFKNNNVMEAAQWVMYEKMKGIEGGIIVLDKEGKGSFPFNTPIMNRGYITLTGEPHVFIYK